VYEEPWSDIREYPEQHKAALEAELKSEIGGDHMLANRALSILAKREDQDDVLVLGEGGFYIVHLTWSGRTEPAPYPVTERFASKEHLEMKLAQDAQWY